MVRRRDEGGRGKEEEGGDDETQGEIKGKRGRAERERVLDERGEADNLEEGGRQT